MENEHAYWPDGLSCRQVGQKGKLGGSDWQNATFKNMNSIKAQTNKSKSVFERFLYSIESKLIEPAKEENVQSVLHFYDTLSHTDRRYPTAMHAAIEFVFDSQVSTVIKLMKNIVDILQIIAHF